MTLKQRKQAEKILKGLESQTFYDFYVGADCEFDEYIQNRVYEPAERERLTKEILERITELFNLK